MNRPYECDVSKKSPNRFSLADHQRHLLMSNDKQYECDVCNKRFLTSSNLLTHKNTHTGDRPYECDVCRFSV